ncbi:MAG: energy transducer TonB [Rhodocyclaceae bacterium]|nr:energy transducer TonB [Rhodocyclaceae bacterium]
MPHLSRNRLLFAAFGSLALHAFVFALAGSNHLAWFSRKPDVPKVEKKAIFLELVPWATDTHRLQAPPVPPAAVIATQARQQHAAATTVTKPQPATQPAPAAPTADEWAFVGQYTLKNSKAYRYSWGKQVRSMMGTAVAGENAGEVRFRLEIAPDGTLARLETLWTTSGITERRARKAIESMPPLPPTPTGKPLIFERTISFTPSGSDWPPIYDDDCLPDPPVFTSPYAWDGKSPQVAHIESKPVEKLDPQVLLECLRQLPRNSIEAEVAREQRLQNHWGYDKLGE